MTKRKNGHYLPLAGFLLCLIWAWPASVALAQDPTPASTEAPAPFDHRFGIVDSFVNTTAANDAGAGWSRVFFRWDVIQPAGPTDWKPTNVPDPLLEAEIAAGRETIAVLIGTPTWATESGASTAAPPLEYWGDFVFKIATQYKGRIKHWVIWNQPDIADPTSPGHTWDGSTEDYYRLLKEAYLKIKTVDPAMQVHLAGLTYTWDSERGNPQYLSRLLELIEADPEAVANNYFFDAVSYHLYYNPRHMLEILTNVRSILDAHGLATKPIWINETNAPPSEDYLEPPEATGSVSITLAEQSAFVIQAFALALAGGADRIAFNKLRNSNPHPESVEPYGLLRGDESRRPAFTAFQVVTTHFAGVNKTSWLQLGDIYIVTLDRGGQTSTVLWNTTTAPISFRLNAIASQATLVDEHGNQQTITAADGVHIVELPAAICSNGPQACFIGGAPRLIVETGSADQRVLQLPLASPPTAATLSDEPEPLSSASGTPTPEIQSPAIVETPPTLTPTPVHEQEPAPELPSAAENIAPIMDVLPDSNLGQTDLAALTTLNDPPPVTITTVLRPDRIFWLFIIGLIVFTVSYGVQVAMWYRWRR